MSEAEVTREQAATVAQMHRTEIGTGLSTAMGRTILALYDDRDVRDSIIDRLCDGWGIDFRTMEWVTPRGTTEWTWEPMTPEQAAVMSRE